MVALHKAWRFAKAIGLEIMRNRFEGTQYSPDETGRTDMLIGNTRMGRAPR